MPSGTFHPVLFNMINFRFSLLSALLAGTLLFACKGDKTNTAWKHNDNTVRVRQASNILTLNPYLYRSVYEVTAFELVFQALMGFDPKTLALSPQLVKAAPTVQDITDGPFKGGQSFTFEILDEAAWDDGKPVTGKDFEFTLKAVFNPKMETQRFKTYLQSLRDIQVDATNPKRFTVVTGSKYFLNKEAIATLVVLPAHVFDPEGLMAKFSFKDLADPAQAAKINADSTALRQFADNFNQPKFSREAIEGSGPYKLAEFVEGQRVVLAKKANWWGTKLAAQSPLLVANPDTIVFMPIEDQTAAVAALKEESVDVATELDAKLFNDLRRDSSFVKDIYDFYTPPTFVYFYTAINTRNPKLSDKKVRRALAHLADMDAAIRDLYDGLGERLAGPFSPDKKYYDSSLKPIEFSLEKAKALLDEAGWKDSNGNGTVDKMVDGALVEMKLQYMYSPKSNYQAGFTELFKNNAQKVGIEIERVALEENVMSEKLRSGEYELGGKGARNQPVPDDPTQLWHTESAKPGGTNYSKFGNAESDALIGQIANAASEADREPLYKQFQQLIYDEQPVIFQLCPLAKTVVHKRFEATISRNGLSLAHLKLK